MANRQNFFLTMGEDQTLSMTARSSSGAVLDLTGATITWKMGSGANRLILEKTGSIVSAAAGTFSVALTDSDTDPTVNSGRNYKHQAFVTVSGTTTMAVAGRIRFDNQIVSAT